MEKFSVLNLDLELTCPYLFMIFCYPYIYNNIKFKFNNIFSYLIINNLIFLKRSIQSSA